MKNKFIFLHIFSLCLGIAGFLSGLTLLQSAIISIFTFSILGSLLFWEFRLGFVFIGSGVFLFIGAVDLDAFIRFASLDVILFLVSMMIIVGMMKDTGLFDWLVTKLIRLHNLDGRRLFFILMGLSAFLSAVMGEVASIIIMVTVILNICKFFEIKPTPLVISSVFATNIGSAATVLGNPVGVLIAARSHFSFEDFLIHALPVSVIVLIISVWILSHWYKSYLLEITKKFKPYQDNEGFLKLISIPPDKGSRWSMIFFSGVILMISLHKRFEILLNLPNNTLLIAIPVIAAGVVMIFRHERARYYIEHEVEWNSLLFFMFLFAQAGVLRATGVAEFIALKLTSVVGTQPMGICGVVLFLGGALSSVLDNVVTVASIIPVVESLDTIHSNLNPLWWSLLFGACFGGNITMIGSTANIVALGLLEKENEAGINFREWLKIGLLIGIISMMIAYFAIFFLTAFYSS